MMNWELRRREWLWPVLRHLRSTYVEGLKKTTKFSVRTTCHRAEIWSRQSFSVWHSCLDT